VLPLLPPGNPPLFAIIIRRLMEKSNQKRVKGMHPLECLPLLGREGVTLIAAAENKRNTLKKRVSTKPFQRWLSFSHPSLRGLTVTITIFPSPYPSKDDI